jgi:uncharacterized coiled-coil DUF342 family protein
METETEEPAPDAPAGDAPAPSEYAGLKVADLKEKLREQELPVSGTKAELLARLEEAGTSGEETAEAAIDYSKLSQKELKAHRKEVNEAAEVLRIKRDEMNLESQSHAAMRNMLNNEAKVQMEQVQYQRTLRNGLNFDVSQVRDERRGVLDEVDQLREQFLSLKRARFSGTHLPPVPKLRRQIQELEIKQMTSSMSIKKERELVEKIGALQAQITAQDEMMDGDEEVAAARDLFRAGEKKRKELTQDMKRVRDAAQNAHELMREALKANRIARRKADAAQRAFVNSKEQADEVHANYIEQLRQLSAIDKVVAERRRGGTGASAIENVANAEELFSKFLAGEKLSTEQLMIIQKAGML